MSQAAGVIAAIDWAGADWPGTGIMGGAASAAIRSDSVALVSLGATIDYCRDVVGIGHAAFDRVPDLWVRTVLYCDAAGGSVLTIRREILSPALAAAIELRIARAKLTRFTALIGEDGTVTSIMPPHPGWSTQRQRRPLHERVLRSGKSKRLKGGERRAADHLRQRIAEETA